MSDTGALYEALSEDSDFYGAQLFEDPTASTLTWEILKKDGTIILSSSSTRVVIRTDPLLRDPAGFRDGLNRYAYTSGDPIDKSDPFGLWGIAFGNDNGTSFINIGFGNPSLYYSPQSVTQIGESAAAALDGLNPFGDPFANHGYYNKCDRGNQLSHARAGEHKSPWKPRRALVP